jgi:hypothetical protein
MTHLRLAAECVATIVSFLAFSMIAITLAAMLKG